MSISTLTTLGAVRDEGVPTKSDVGKAKTGADTDVKARISDTLVTSIPTEVVAAYTAALAAVVGLIDEKTKKHFPDQFRNLRWGMFAALLLITVVSIFLSYRAKSQKRIPIPEMATGTLAAAIWGLSLPDSPLVPSLNGDNKTLVPTLIVLGAGTLLVALANVLTKASNKVTNPP